MNNSGNFSLPRKRLIQNVQRYVKVQLNESNEIICVSKFSDIIHYSFFISEATSFFIFKSAGV